MPVIRQTDEERREERIQEQQDRAWEASREDEKLAAKYEHEQEIARLKLAVPQRHKTVTRIVLGIAKAPALVILAIMLPVLVLRGKDIPIPLAKFMDL